jgi:hypothetical protein
MYYFVKFPVSTGKTPGDENGSASLSGHACENLTVTERFNSACHGNDFSGIDKVPVHSGMTLIGNGRAIS